MFGHKSRPSIRFAFRVVTLRKALTENERASGEFTGERRCLEQLHAGRKYFNRLLAIEQERRLKAAEIMRSLAPAIAGLEAEVAELTAAVTEQVAALNAKRGSARKRIVDKELSAEIKRLKAARKECWGRLRTERTLAKKRPEIVAAMAVVNKQTNQTRREARAESGLYWGSYLKVERDAKNACAAIELKFRRWPNAHGPAGKGLSPRHDRIEGTLAVQLQGGLSPESMFAGDDTRLRIEAVDDRAWLEETPRGERKMLARTRVSMRIGTAEDGRSPIFASFPIVLHRQLPADCRVKWGELVRRTVADCVQWEFHLIVSREAGWQKPVARSGVVGIDVGYRRLDEGLRVAYWIGDDGREGQLVLPEKMLKERSVPRQLRGTRDVEMDRLLLFLASWLGGRSVPDWLTTATQGTPERPTVLRLWKSPLRLHDLHRQWASARFDGDGEAFKRLAEWHHQDRHLWQWAANVDGSVVRWRTDLYRKFAADLRRHYKVAGVEQLDLKQLARRPNAEDEAIDGALVNHRNLASLGMLFEVLSESGMDLVRHDPKHTTQDHAECGHRNNYDRPAMLMVRCDGCGAVYDQDRNAAQNLLRMFASGEVAEAV